jgi:hypothetical protein
MSRPLNCDYDTNVRCRSSVGKRQTIEYPRMRWIATNIESDEYTIDYTDESGRPRLSRPQASVDAIVIVALNREYGAGLLPEGHVTYSRHGKRDPYRRTGC